MATTGVGFRWLDILEKEFDKACVELDTSLGKCNLINGHLHIFPTTMCYVSGERHVCRTLLIFNLQ